MYNRTIGLDKFYTADLNAVMIDSYNEADELIKLKKIIYSRKKAFILSENYLYLLEKLGFTIYTPIESGSELDLGCVIKFLDSNKISINYTHHYQLKGEKSVDLFLDQFFFDKSIGIQFYYLTVKSFSNSLHDLDRQKWPFLIKFEYKGDVTVEFKRIENGSEKIVYNYYNTGNTFKSYQMTNDFFISEIHFYKHQVKQLYFNWDGKSYSFFEICQYLPYLQDIGQDKIAKGKYIISKDEITLMRMNQY